MAQPDTLERILNAAEQLFAQRGFTETSLRSITSHAGVNLAAVNYHFGSKEALIEAVFARFLDDYTHALEVELERVQSVSHSKPDPEALLQLLVDQIFSIEPRVGGDVVVFMKLLGLAFSQNQGHLRQYLDQRYGNVFRRYMLLLHESAPHIPLLELFWRINFMLGAASFSVSGIKALRAMAETGFGVHTSLEGVMCLMVPFLAAGLQAHSAVVDKPPCKWSPSKPPIQL